MKVLFWTDGFWPRIGGIERIGFEYIRLMQERGHEFLVLAQHDHPNWPEDDDHCGIRIKRFNFNAMISQNDFRVVRQIQKFLESISSEFQFDIIHLYANVGGSALAFLLFSKFFQVPIIETVHLPYFHETQAKISLAADRICCVSHWVLKEMQANFPLFKDKLSLIYNGLSMPIVQPQLLPFKSPSLLLFGRLVKEKGFDVGLYAFSLLKQNGSNAQLIVAGGGPERENLEKLAVELGLLDSIQFTGVLTNEELIETYNRSTVVIVPSRIESFGLVILEAMQWGRPVIASNIEGIPEVVRDGETGILVPPNDPVELFHAMQMLLNDSELAQRMGIAARKRAEQFSLIQNANEYQKIYESFVLV